MMVRNNQREALASTLTLDEFAEAMSALDLSSVPPEKRSGAIMERLVTIMSRTVLDPSERARLSATLAVARSASSRSNPPN